MLSLAQFSGEESELLVSLPYRVGLYVSYVDDEEGDTDDAREMQSLKSCIQAIAALPQERPFAAAVMKETLRLHFEWKRWNKNPYGQICEDAARAISLLKSKADEETVKSYAAALMEIAETVARANGEFSAFDQEDEDKKDGIFSSILKKVAIKFSGMPPEDAGHPMNISASEDSALSRLSSALRI
ncbi:MAG: hypothetical protein IT559_02980 [Alphaproteobacteria bacterium]|nr:hypothetical protein [Alphaproteobacteria bacterium]